MIVGTWTINLQRNLTKLLTREYEPGCDVSHPSPGVVNRPSIASVVSSIDREATQYSALVGVQEPRQEIIANVGSMVRVCRLFHSAIRLAVAEWR